MDEEWDVIHEFQSYKISSFGRVLNRDTGREIKPSYTKQGAAKVGLMDGGSQFTRSLKVLVADAFVPGRSEEFDTPIHLDGDQKNCAAINLLWRPRAFAWRYARQFIGISIHHNRGPVVDVETGMVYSTMFEAAKKNGILVADIWRTIIVDVKAFPTQQRFELQKQV